MGTRSNIAIQNADGTVSAIYCHWDGYPSKNGRILLQSYQDEAKVKALIALGSLSCLEAEIGEKRDFDSRKPEHENMCLAYGRDRGEENVDAASYPDAERFLAALGDDVFIEYAYLFRDGKWYWTDAEQPWALLTQEIVAAD